MERFFGSHGESGINSSGDKKEDKVSSLFSKLSWEQAIQFPLYHLVKKGMCTHQDLYTILTVEDIVTAWKMLDIENAIIEMVIASIVDGLTEGIGKSE